MLPGRRAEAVHAASWPARRVDRPVRPGSRRKPGGGRHGDRGSVPRAFADFFDRQARPALIETGATPLACLQTEHAENTFPALPVRTGENVFVWLARFPSDAHLDGHLRQLERSGRWQDRVLPALSALIAGRPQRLRLAPTARSLLR